MSPTQVEVQGTLQPDGTLVLDEKPALPPGRVRVTVQPVLDYTQTPLWKFFEQLRAEQQARGFVPRSKEEIDADIAALREEEERTQEIERIQEECRRAREQAARGGPS
ncbi:MAG: hypothetical protein HYS12_16515 [Planctomycetes bacterium]|nr:hypothetical protein [Planctomycetota bacterium]